MSTTIAVVSAHLLIDKHPWGPFSPGSAIARLGMEGCEVKTCCITPARWPVVGLLGKHVARGEPIPLFELSGMLVCYMLISYK